MQGDNKVVAAVNKMTANTLNVENAVVKVDSAFAKTLKVIEAGISRIKISSITQQVNQLADGLNSVAAPGLNLSTSMADLSAITGITGDKLKEIEGYARQNAKAFGGDAAQSVESYKLVLSQLSPELAKQPKALQEMGNSISTLSKTMGGDTVAATEVLTTALNQYGVSMDDPAEASKNMAAFMNVMAAAAKEGSAELPQIKQALENAGMAAKGAGVTFSEANAAIQVLDKSGKKGAEGGVALRNALAIMGQGRFMPKEARESLQAAGVNVLALGDKSLSLSDRLNMLKPIMNDSALLTKVFGMENQNAARALISGSDEIAELNQKIVGTNTAYEQAAVIMESPAEKAKRLQANIDDLKISMFNATGGIMGYAKVFGDLASTVSNFAPILDFITNKQKLKAMWDGIVAGATWLWNGAQTVLNATFWANPLTWIIALIIAIIAAIAYVIIKTDGWGQAWNHVVKGAKLLWQAFTGEIKWMFDTFVNGVMIGVLLLQKAWYGLMKLLGKSGASEKLQEIDTEINQRKEAIIKGREANNKLWSDAANEFSAAAGSLKWNEKTDAVGTVKKSLGLGPTEPTAPGAGAGAGGKIPGGNPTGKSNEAIATGGTKNTTIHINIGKQIESLHVISNNIREGAQQIRDIIVDEMTRALTMSQAIAE